MTIQQECLDLLPELIKGRRYLHQNPETGNELDNTKKFVSEHLKQMGFLPYSCGGGIVCDLNLHKDKTILIRADMDALPEKEDSGLEFASKKNCAHLCGHDLHIMVLLGTCKILLNNVSKLNCNVRFMFQDDEERVQGAKRMIDDGVLNGVDYAFMAHTKPNYKTGLINCTSGKKMASMDRFEIEIIGKGGHGSMPKICNDPIKAASKLILKLDNIVDDYLKPNSANAISVGMVNAGTSPNIIPNTAFIKGTMRGENEEDRKLMKDALKNICEQIEKEDKVQIINEYTASVNSLTNNPELVEFVKPSLDLYLGDMVDYTYDFTQVSEDFALVAALVPSICYNFGTGESEYSLHNPKIIFDETSMVNAVLCFVATALAF